MAAPSRSSLSLSLPLSLARARTQLLVGIVLLAATPAVPGSVLVSGGRVRAQLFAVVSWQHSGTHFVRSVLNGAVGSVVCGDELPQFGKWCAPPPTGPVGSGDNFNAMTDVLWGRTPFAEVANATDWKKGKCARTHVPGCGSLGNASRPASYAEHADRIVSRATARGFIWQQGSRTLGRPKPQLLRHLTLVQFRAIILWRSNVFAHAMASSNVRRVAVAPVRKRILSADMLRDIVLPQKFAHDAFRTLSASRLPAIMVKYELLVTKPAAFVLLFDFLGVPVAISDDGHTLIASSWTYMISNSTKHHQMPPSSYIANLEEAAGMCARLGEPCQICMLDDTCPEPTLADGLSYANFSPSDSAAVRSSLRQLAG
jgi:hypothetical protein